MSDDIALFDGMLQRIEDLVALERGYTPARMVEWSVLRAKFKEERQKRGLKQEWVASRGRLEQSQISKIEGTEDYMPSLDTFLRRAWVEYDSG